MSNLSLKSAALDQSHHYWACFLDLQTPDYRAVLAVLCDIQGDLIKGIKKDTQNTREYIAQKAKVSVSTVRNVIRDCEGICFTHQSRRRDDSCQHLPNTYDVFPYFMETVFLLKLNSYYHKWKEVRERVLSELEKNDYFLVEKTLKLWRLSTTILPTVFMQNLPTIKSYSSLHLDNGTLRQNTQKAVDNKKKADAIFGKADLTHYQKENLIKFYAPVDLIEAKKAFDWYTLKQGNTVRCAVGWFRHMAMQSCAKRMQGVRR